MFYKKRIEALERDTKGLLIEVDNLLDAHDENFLRVEEVLDGILAIMGKTLINSMVVQKGDHDLGNGWVLRSTKKVEADRKKSDLELKAVLKKITKKKQK